MRSRKPPEEDTPEIHGMANLWMHAWRANTSRHTQPHTYRCLCWHNRLTSYQRNHPACFSSPRVPLLFFLTAACCYLRKGLWGPPSLLLKMFVGASNILEKAQFPLFKVQCAQDCFSSGWKKKKKIKSENLNNSQTAGPGKCGNQGKPRSPSLVSGVPISVKPSVGPRCLPHTFL